MRSGWNWWVRLRSASDFRLALQLIRVGSVVSLLSSPVQMVASRFYSSTIRLIFASTASRLKL